ncbi:MAG: hypothetical protein JSR44_12785 [Spirochaetes bacterium]|nr:hypothetical protein [Spirochaetota bacterium]
MKALDFELPFRATESERRILGELYEIARLREGAVSAALYQKEILMRANIASSEGLIAYLQRILFPQEAAVRAARAERLQALQTATMRAHFDSSLETSTLTLQIKIKTAKEYAAMLSALTIFDFVAWQETCAGERSDAD